MIPKASRCFGVETDDTTLVRLAVSGESRAFEIIVRRYQKLVYNMLYQMGRSHELAADLTQDTFTRAYKGLSGFKIGAPIKPWLLRIATNAWLNAIRDKKESVSLDEMLEENPYFEPPSRQNVESEVESRLSHQQLESALQQITPRQRQVFVLRYTYDLSYEEIGNITGEPVTTIKPLLFRIRERLRKIMTAESTALDYPERR